MDLRNTRPPFSLLAYGANEGCRLAGGAEHRAELISIGMGEARVRLGAAAEGLFRHDERCQLHLNRHVGGRPVSAPCAVVWINGRELGLNFDARLELGVLHLQQTLNRGAQPLEERA